MSAASQRGYEAFASRLGNCTGYEEALAKSGYFAGWNDALGEGEPVVDLDPMGGLSGWWDARRASRPTDPARLDAEAIGALAALLRHETRRLRPALVARIRELEAERDAARRCLGFFASVIKSGETWTATCEAEYRAALASAPAEGGP